MHAVVLNFAGCHLGDAHLPKERQQVDAKPDFVAFGPTLAALSLSYDLVLLKEPLGRLREGFLRKEDASPVFTPKFKVLVLGDLLCQGQAFLLRARTALLTAYRGGALPNTAFPPLIELNLAAENFVIWHSTPASARRRHPDTTRDYQVT